jgi:hypothetical protein
MWQLTTFIAAGPTVDLYTRSEEMFLAVEEEQSGYVALIRASGYYFYVYQFLTANSLIGNKTGH